MKLSNFRDHRQDALGHKHAIVDVEVGWLFWKKKTSRRIGKRRYDSYWRFADTGEFTPEYQAENLAAAHELSRDISK